MTRLFLPFGVRDTYDRSCPSVYVTRLFLPFGVRDTYDRSCPSVYVARLFLSFSVCDSYDCSCLSVFIQQAEAKSWEQGVSYEEARVSLETGLYNSGHNCLLYYCGLRVGLRLEVCFK